jgi:hypothetical protein
MPSLTLATRIRRELRIRTVKRASGPWTEVTLREVHIPHPDDEGPPRFRLRAFPRWSASRFRHSSISALYRGLMCAQSAPVAM